MDESDLNNKMDVDREDEDEDEDAPGEVDGDAPANDHERGQTKCETVLCIDSGPALEVRWCPLPCHDGVGRLSFPLFSPPL